MFLYVCNEDYAALSAPPCSALYDIQTRFREQLARYSRIGGFSLRLFRFSFFRYSCAHVFRLDAVDVAGSMTVMLKPSIQTDVVYISGEFFGRARVGGNNPRRKIKDTWNFPSSPHPAPVSLYGYLSENPNALETIPQSLYFAEVVAVETMAANCESGGVGRKGSRARRAIIKMPRRIESGKIFLCPMGIQF